jgi:hypothetical protein
MADSTKLSAIFNRIYKKLPVRHTDIRRHAGLRNDEKQMAIIESQLETEKAYGDPDFDVRELAD